MSTYVCTGTFARNLNAQSLELLEVVSVHSDRRNDITLKERHTATTPSYSLCLLYPVNMSHRSNAPRYPTKGDE